MISICALVHLSCKSFPLSGTIELPDSGQEYTIYLIDPMTFKGLVASYGGKVIDSAYINKKGFYSFDKMPEVIQDKLFILALHKKGEKYPNKLENENIENANYVPFFYNDHSKIRVDGQGNALLKTAIIHGNQKQNDHVMSLIKSKYDLYDSYISSLKENDEDHLIDNEKALYHYQKALFESVLEIKNPFLSALALRWASPNNDYERLPELVKQACTDFQDLQPLHSWTKEICTLSSTLPKTAGDVFPDFPLPMMEGDTLATYAILGKKITLIDFWASWCAPCRKENKEILVPLWEKYHDKGFQIIGYALDSSEKGWKNAIVKDGADRWHHASHLQGDISPLFDVLKMTTIPTNYIVDDKGVILAKNLHGLELVGWVERYFE